MKKIVPGLIIFCFSLLAHAEVQTKVIEYKVNGESFTGYLAYDDSVQGKRPGILVAHEWWGHNDYVRKRAEMLAELGYTAFALDMFGTGKLTDHPDEAGKFVQMVMSNVEVAEKRFEAAYNLLRNQPTVNPEKIAAVGYCFGGGTSLHMARQGMDLDAVVSFHGALATKTPAQDGEVNADLLILTGGADPMVPAEQVEAFRKEMTDANVAFRIYSYPDAKHGFTNPGATELGKRYNLPFAYDAAADKDSWEKMREFLNEIFAKE